MTDIEQKAFKFAQKKHEGQLYGGGDFFLNHPLQVYTLLNFLAPEDTNLLVAALLHDTIEDTKTYYDELVEEFNKDVADLVQEVTKGQWNQFPHLKTQRGVVLKFADRLCNLRSMESWTKEKQERYIQKSKFWKD